MPASPLAAAILGGNDSNASLLGLDPAAMQALPDIQLGQSLEQGGLSTAPAYPAQALARILQTATGEYVKHQAIGDLAKTYANAPAHLADVLEKTQPGNPVIPMLRDPDPAVRMTGMQLVSKIVPLQSELQKTNPNETVSSGPKTVYTNQGPATPLAKAMADARNAQARGDTTTADTITRGVNKDTMIGDTGVQPPPIPLNPPRVMPRPTGGGASRSAAIEPPPVQPSPQQMLAAKQKLGQNLTNVQNSGGTAPSATGIAGQQIPKDVGAPSSPGTPAPAQSLTDQIAAAKGTQAASEKLYGGASEALGKTIGEQIEAGGKVARDKMNALDSIQDALNAGGRGVATGPYADKILKAKEALDGWGIDTSWVKAGMPESEVVSKMNAQLASASAKAMTGRPTQFEFSAWMKNNPGLLTSKQGTTALLNILHQTTQQEIDLGRMAQNKTNWDKWGDTVDNYYQKHPLISPFTNKPMAAAGSSSAPNATPAAPSAGGGWSIRRVQPKAQQ